MNEIKNKEYVVQKFIRINKVLDKRSKELIRHMKVLCDLGVRANTCVAIYATTIAYNFTVNIFHKRHLIASIGQGEILNIYVGARMRIGQNGSFWPKLARMNHTGQSRPE